MKEMKTLTIEDKTYEIVDEYSRNCIEQLNIETTEDGGQVFNDIETNEAIAPYSTALGTNTRAGVYGYRLKEVRNNDGKTAEIIVDDADLADKARDKYAAKDTLCFDGKSHFYTELTIAENGLYSIDIDGKAYSVIKVNISELTVKPTTGVQVDTNDDGSYNTDEKENWAWVAEKSFGIPMLRSQGAFASGVAEDGELTLAIGYGAFSSGRNSRAVGDYAHTEGRNTVANYAAHAEGLGTKALNQYAHAEGSNTQALAIASHAEGANTIATGQRSHAEGASTQAIGNNSHSEGSYTIAQGANSHSEGGRLDEETPTVAAGDYSHAEGQGTQAVGLASHSEGRNNIAEGNYSHVEGRDNQANGVNSHVEGNVCQTGPNADNAHAEGHGTKALGVASHSEGWGTQAYCDYQHAQGRWNVIDTKGRYAHIVGNGNVDRTDPSNPITTRSNAHTIDWDGNAWFAGDVTVGAEQEKLLRNSEVPDWAKSSNKPSYDISEVANAAGKKTTSTSEVFNDTNNTATSTYAHAEGQTTKATGRASHAEGYSTTASGTFSHAEGEETTASKEAAHAEGRMTKAIANHSHAEGLGTISACVNQHVQGKYNIADVKRDSNGNMLDSNENVTTDVTKAAPNNKYAHIVGGGSSDTNRKNIHTLDWQGNAWFSSNVKIGGTGYDDENARRLPVIYKGTSAPDTNNTNGSLDGDIYIMYNEE